MHLETANVVLWDNLNSGAKFGDFVGDVGARSGYGAGHVEALCQVVVPKCCPPKTKNLSGFWRALFHPVGGLNAGMENILGPDWGQIWLYSVLLRHLEATAVLLGTNLEAFASRNARKILSGFLRAMLALFGVREQPSWGQFRRFWGCVEGFIWDHFGHVAKASSKTIQTYTSKTLSPVALEA